MRNRNRFASFWLSIVMLLAFCPQLHAVPASPKIVKEMQKDGSTITIRIQGDEFFNWRTTEDGYPVVEQDGYFYYASYNANGAYTLSQERAVINGKRIMPSSAIKKNNMQPIAATASKASRAAAAAKVPSRSDLFDSSFPSEGEIRSLVILVEYYDVKFSVKNPNEAFTNQLNQKGYDVEGATGSARDYFLANSGGKFDGHFDVCGPYELSQPQRYYGANSSSNGQDLRAAEMIEEAVKLAANNGVNFADYDYNNDGFVDNIFVYYAGRSEAEGGGADCVWPHKWNVPSQPEYNGKTVDVYACTSELRGASTDDEIIAGIGTFCHEFSHVFGLADHYDTDGSNNGSSYGLGAYDIMTIGSYNNNGNTPPLHNGLERMMIGWADPEELDKEQDITLLPLNDGKVYKMSTDIEGEFFLFENRNRNNSIWDYYIPGEGLIITHVDQSEPYEFAWAANNPNGNTSHECFKFVVAGNVALDYTTGWDKVPYPYTDIWAAANSNNEWSPNSNPKSRNWSGGLMPYQITDIAKDGQNITFKVSKATVNSVAGTVKNAYGKYISNAQVKLTNNATSAVYAGVTDSNGEMVFADDVKNNIPDGNYTMEVTADSYAPYTKTFDLIQGIELYVTLFSIEQGTMHEVGHHNKVFDHGVGSAYQIRPMTIITADMLKEHIGRSIKEVRFYAAAPFEGQVIIQPGLYGGGWSPGPMEVTEADLGWRTADFSGLYAGGTDIIVQPNTDYYVRIMVMTDTEANPAIGMDDSTDQSLYKISSLLDVAGETPKTIFSTSGIEGNLLISLALSEESMYVTPTSFNTNPAFDSGIPLNVNEIKPLAWGTIPANGNPACNWESADESIVTVSSNGTLTGRGMGSTTITGVSVLDPNVKMTYTVNVATSEARATGRIVKFVDDIDQVGKFEGIENLTLKFYQVEAAEDTFVYRAPAKQSNAKSKVGSIEGLSPLSALKFNATYLEDNDVITATSGADGVYNVEGLVAGSKYVIKLEQDTYTDPWRATSQTTYYAMTEYDPENAESINDLGQFIVFENTIFGTERINYYTGEAELNSVGDNSSPVMYAIRIPAEKLTDKIGHQITHMDAYLYNMKDPYVEAIVFTLGENGELIYQGGTSHGDNDAIATNGQHIFEFVNEEPAIVRPETDYYVTVQMMGAIGAQSSTSDKNDGYSNLVWNSTTKEFVTISETGIMENVDWQISMYTKEREIEPVSSIAISAVTPDAYPCAGVEYALKAVVNPSTATYKDVVWSSSDTNIATIDENGVATLIKDGKVTFTAQSTQYSDVKGELTLNVALMQGIYGFVADSDGNSVANAEVIFYPATYTTSNVGAMLQKELTRTSDKGIKATSDEGGYFYIDMEEGVYEIEAKSKGLMDYQGVVTVGYGLNDLKVMMYQYVETLSDFMCYTEPAVDTAIGDESYNFIPYTRWDAEDLEEHVGKQITRFKALVIGAANIRFIVFTPKADKYLYRSPLISVAENNLEMVVHDIPANKCIDIEEGQDYCIGYEVADYASDVAPAVISRKTPTIAGKSDCIVYRNELTTLTDLANGESDGNWVLGFYIQDAEQQQGINVNVGQRDAVVTWNPSAYKSFVVSYGKEGGVQTTVTCDDCKLEIDDLEVGTKYDITISGVETVGSYVEIAESSFTTLEQKTTIPMIRLNAYNGYTAGEILTLKTLNTEPTDDIEWYLNSEKLSRNSIVLEVGEQRIQCRIIRGSRSFITTKYINVEQTKQ